MPQVFKVGGYWVFFWSNEGDPIEPVHVHVVEGRPTEQSTKIWITSSGKCLIANNASRIPDKALRNVVRVIEARSDDVIRKWKDYYGTISFYC